MPGGGGEAVVVEGSMVQLETVQGDRLAGVVRYTGPVPGRQGTAWAGVELEEEVRGGGSGWIQASTELTILGICN